LGQCNDKKNEKRKALDKNQGKTYEGAVYVILAKMMVEADEADEADDDGGSDDGE
jgi:hypothetical protein